MFLVVVLRRRRFDRNDDLSITCQCRQPKLNRLSTRSVNASCSYVIPVPLFFSPPSPYSYNPRCTPPHYIWKSRWPPLTVRSVIFRRSHEITGDCEQSNCSREMLISKPIHFTICGGRHLKGPRSPKRLCALVFLFWNDSFVKCSVLIGFHFEERCVTILKTTARETTIAAFYQRGQ